MNVILRPVFDRPEMLYLSLEYECNARNYYKFPYDLTTMFIVEYGSPQKVLDLIESYEYPKIVIQRGEKFGLSKNILLGMKDAFELADDFVIYIEDDVLIWKHYFQFMDVLLNMFSKNEYSVLASYNGDDNGDVYEIYKGSAYTALAPLINKDFFENYIEPCITPIFYENFTSRDRFVRALNEKYKKYWGKGYKYTNGSHNQQAGMLNRLVDVSIIEESKYVITPYVNRQQHIGFVGFNRPGGKIPGNSFEERVYNLREIITSADSLYKFTSTKQYKDYKVFCEEKLNQWDGALYLK